jgi:leucine dehydrogenase
MGLATRPRPARPRTRTGMTSTSIESTHPVFDGLTAHGLERLRLRRHGAELRILVAEPDGPFEPALPRLQDLGPQLQEARNLMEAGSHDRLDFVLRLPLGLRFVAAVHDGSRGMPSGGLWRVDLSVPERDAVLGLLNLARAMSLKNRASGIPRGGAGLMVHGTPLPETGREDWLQAIAEEIEFAGILTRPDSGFPPAVQAALAERSRLFVGTREGGTSASLAFGVHQAIRATLAACGLPLAEARVVVQGLGAVGAALVPALAAGGARLVITDRDHRRIDLVLDALPEEARARTSVVAPYQAAAVEADLLAPCAVAGVLSAGTIPALRVRAVCGGASNVLLARTMAEELALARLLHSRGILFVPDWISSAGGTLHAEMEHELGPRFDLHKVHARILRVCGWELDRVLDEAKRSGRPPMEIALESLCGGTR